MSSLVDVNLDIRSSFIHSTNINWASVHPSHFARWAWDQEHFDKLMGTLLSSARSPALDGPRTCSTDLTRRLFRKAGSQDPTWKYWIGTCISTRSLGDLGVSKRLPRPSIYKGRDCRMQKRPGQLPRPSTFRKIRTCSRELSNLA